MRVAAIVLAAGEGKRFQGDIPKPLIPINKYPTLSYCLKALQGHRFIRDIIVVVNKGNAPGIRRLVTAHRIRKVTAIVNGGRLRQESVVNGLGAVGKDISFVLIHDGVRPFITPQMISAVISAAKRAGAAIVAVPVKATIKEVGQHRSRRGWRLRVIRTVPRQMLWEVQTPQVFRKEIIQMAFDKYGKQIVTDDAALVEKIGIPVEVVEGSYTNIKITTPDDLVIAEAVAGKRRGMCH